MRGLRQCLPHRGHLSGGRHLPGKPGIYTARGAFGNLPAGEAYIAPVEGTGEGVLVVPAGWFPDLTENMVLRFEAGEGVALQGGGEVGRNLAIILGLPAGEPGRTMGLPARDAHLRNRRNLAELLELDGIRCIQSGRLR